MGEVDLTVIVPVFNRNESLKRAVATVVSQSDRISVVIIDDGSSSEFAAVADELAATCAATVRVVHQTNQGPAAARNVGLGVTTSRFVMFLDSDDELADSAFTAIDHHLLRGDGVGMVCGAIRVVSPGGAARIDPPVVLPGVPWARLSWVCGSFAVRTDIARAVGGYDEALGFGENTDFILRLAEECRKRSLGVAGTNDVLCVYNQAPEERRYDAKRLDAAIHLLRRGRLDLHIPSERARLHAIAAVNAARVGRYPLSMKHAALASLTEPGNRRHLARLALSLTGPLARRRWLRT
jgi:glycosyltransferase involved in cell wall biosynthesis